MKNLGKWILAARPKTLPAAIVPVVIAGGIAASVDQFNPAPWAVCLLFAILIQTGTNFANDYYDFLKGADDARRIGPQRAVASGWISPKSMLTGTIVVFVLAFFVGCLLIPYSGWWIVPVGLVCISCGVAYTGGPYPLGYNGWGDAFVFIFFGWVATLLTYYVQTGTFEYLGCGVAGLIWIFLAGMVPGALATNLLAVNNVRDEPLDREAGKRTLVVRFGRRFGLWEYRLMSMVAISVPLLFGLYHQSPWCSLVLLSLPLTLSTNRKLGMASDRDSYDRVLAQTAILLMLTGGLFAVGLAIG